MNKNGYVFINIAGLYAKEIINTSSFGPARQEIAWVELHNATVFTSSKRIKNAQAIQAQEQRSVILTTWETKDD